MIDIEKLQELSCDHDDDCEAWEGMDGHHGRDLEPEECTCHCRVIYDACCEIQAAREELRETNLALHNTRNFHIEKMAEKDRRIARQAEELELLRSCLDAVRRDAPELKAYMEWCAKQGEKG